jgi:hypothetical protein
MKMTARQVLVAVIFRKPVGPGEPVSGIPFYNSGYSGKIDFSKFFEIFVNGLSSGNSEK